MGFLLQVFEEGYIGFLSVVYIPILRWLRFGQQRRPQWLPPAGTAARCRAQPKAAGVLNASQAAARQLAAQAVAAAVVAMPPAAPAPPRMLAPQWLRGGSSAQAEEAASRRPCQRCGAAPTRIADSPPLPPTAAATRQTATAAALCPCPAAACGPPADATQVNHCGRRGPAHRRVCCRASAANLCRRGPVLCPCGGRH